MPQAPKSSRPQHPLPEYPRPALRRDSFESLNGVWQYAITKSAKLPPQWDGDILVPYSPEAKASAWGGRSGPASAPLPPQLCPARRGGRPGAAPLRGRGSRLRGAGQRASGGRPPGRLLALYVRHHRRAERDHNRLWVAVQDPTGTGYQARGKQTLKPGGMFYPAQSGIWQTVWLERVPDNYIETLTVTPDYDARTVTVKAHTAQPGGAANLWAVVAAGGVTVAEDWGSDEAGQDGEVTLTIPEEHFFPWSPASPFLYDLTVGTTQGGEESFDTVHSYFALRKWSCEPDKKGILRFCLNGEPILLNGLLDQGYWPEGSTLRPPTRRWSTNCRP